MALLRPFRALRPTRESAARVASVPYDVVSADEARALAEGNPDSFLHVVRPEIDLPEGTSSHSDAAYEKARDNLRELEARGILTREPTPCLYLYRLIMGDHEQTGIVGTFSVEEYDRGAILKHETTRPDKEADRTRHVLTLSAQAGPVFLTYRPDPTVDRLIAERRGEEPFFDFTAPDGIQHTLWRLTDPDALAAAFAAVPQLYIADGHHRSASASNVCRQRREAGTLADDDPSRCFLAVAFPSDQVQILPYNRLVLDLDGRSAGAFLEEVAATVPLERGDDPNSRPDPGYLVRPAPPAGFADMFLAGSWHRLTLSPEAEDPVSRLDVQILQSRILAPLLGIENPRTDDRIAFVGGIRGTGALEDAVNDGRAAVAFSLPPVTPEQLLAVADAGLTLPPKSTWFEPKLRSGLFTCPI